MLIKKKKAILPILAIGIASTIQNPIQDASKILNLQLPHSETASVNRVDYNETSSESSNMETYFRNLADYSPKNVNGSCGYVSLIEYLSYYDAFYNDDIIPTAYERNQGPRGTLDEARLISPGVLRKTYSSEELSNSTIIDNNKGIDYQLFLISKEAQIKGTSFNEYGYWSIHMSSYDQLLKQAVNSSVSFSYVSYSSFGGESPTSSESVTSLKKYVKVLLDCQEPVILHIKQLKNGELINYHSVVAYSYDEEGIHCNFGWGSDSTDEVISEDGDLYITEAGVADFTLMGEKHSNNFPVGETYYCGCGKEHEHAYTKWKYYSPVKHVELCECGAVGTHFGNHTCVGLGRYKTCTLCKGKIDSLKDPIQKDSLNDGEEIYE